MKITPDNQNLVSLVSDAHQGKICIPDFQRNFVWERERVADLLRSIIRGYYIGSLLLLRCEPDRPPFAPSFLSGADAALPKPRPNYLVLDGQQRITALIYALTAPDLALKDSSQRRWFYLDLTLLMNDRDNDEVVFDRAKRDLDGLDRPEIQYEKRILPCTVMLRSHAFLAWRDGLDDWLKEHEPENHEQFRTEWRTEWTSAITTFQNYDVPYVLLHEVDESDPESIGRVCAIFEKLNSTGVELSVYDLLTARLYRSGIKLHELWNAACREHPRLAAWSHGSADTNKLGVLILRTLALLRGLEAKPTTLINLKPEGFENDWCRAARAIERALELLMHVGPDGFGVFAQKWLPGFGLLPVLAALRAEIEDLGLGEEARADLRRWYWCNVFLERYSSAVESKSRKDYTEIMAHWTQDGPEPAVFNEARIRIGAQGYSVRDSASYGSAIYSGLFCLLALNGARDWRVGEDIQLQRLQDHHIFPRAWLRRHGFSAQSEVNSVVNRTLISNGTNGKIGDRAPASYLEDTSIFPSGPRKGLLAPHFIDPDALSWMLEAVDGLSNEDVAACYEEFRSCRETAMVRAIRASCGVSIGEAEPSRVIE